MLNQRLMKEQLSLLLLKKQNENGIFRKNYFSLNCNIFLIKSEYFYNG